MENLKNKKVATSRDDIEHIYDQVREYIEDPYLDKFDAIMDSLEDEEDMEEFFEDVVLDYLNDEIAPEGYGFGIHAKTGDIGFWEYNPKTEDFDLPLPIMRIENIEEEIDEELEPELPEAEVKSPKDRIAEILDEEGEVVAVSPYREEAPGTHQEGVEAGREEVKEV